MCVVTTYYLLHLLGVWLVLGAWCLVLGAWCLELGASTALYVHASRKSNVSNDADLTSSPTLTLSTTNSS